jgi:AbrB family looped-hinge helix DNA binding protein
VNAVISQDGRIEIPRELREELGLEPGNVLEIKNREGTLVVWKRTGPDAFEKWRGRGALPSGMTTEDYLRSARDGDGR